MKVRKLFVGKYFIVFCLVLSVCSPAFSGKIDQVKEAVKNTCQKELPDADVMDAVLKAFDCTAGTQVKLAICPIKCLKENSGNVVGK